MSTAISLSTISIVPDYLPGAGIRDRLKSGFELVRVFSIFKKLTLFLNDIIIQHVKMLRR